MFRKSVGLLVANNAIDLPNPIDHPLQTPNHEYRLKVKIAAVLPLDLEYSGLLRCSFDAAASISMAPRPLCREQGPNPRAEQWYFTVIFLTSKSRSQFRRG